MRYFCGPSSVFDPAPSGSVYAESADGSLQIWAASSYESDMVTEVSKAEADAIKQRPGWA